MTKDDKRWLEDVASLGCIVCRNLSYGATPAEVHHIRKGQGTAQRADHKNSPALPSTPQNRRTRRSYPRRAKNMGRKLRHGD